MTQRINLVKPNPGLEAMSAIESWLDRTDDAKLLALVKVRASQINGCAYCLHMHSKHALKLGESTARLLLLDAWQESALYSERERAALAWTDSLTRISQTHAPDSDFERVRGNFSEEELTALSIAIAMINAWNRLAIGARAEHPSDIRKAA
jgi:AhpD family alkylhydroperoxidase